MVAKGYLVIQTVQTGKQRTINLLPPVDPNVLDKADLEMIQAEEVKVVAKRRQTQERLCYSIRQVLTRSARQTRKFKQLGDNAETAVVA